MKAAFVVFDNVLDPGLHLVQRLADADARTRIAKQMDSQYVP